MTSNKLSRELAEVGRATSPATIRKNWGKGAPRNSASAYLKWEAKQQAESPQGGAARQELKAEKIRKEIELLTERTLAEKRENEKRAGELVAISEVHAAQDRCCARARAVLVQKFETEMPPKQDGMPAAKIAAMNREALDQVFAILSKRETYA